MRGRILFFIGLALSLAGSGLLLSHSSITDIGLVLLLAGGLFTIWYKLGILEARVNGLYAHYEELKTKLEKSTAGRGAKR